MGSGPYRDQGLESHPKRAPWELMTHGAFCQAASSHKIPNMIRNNPIESPGNCWENTPIVCPLCPACCYAPGVSAVSTACRVAEVKANIHPVPSPFRVIGHHRLVVSRLATRVGISMGHGLCPEAAGLAAARFLLRVHPRVRPHQLDGHIRKEDAQRLAVRRPAMVR